MSPTIRFFGVALLTLVSVQALAEQPAQNPLRNVYFGETHMHTAY